MKRVTDHDRRRFLQAVAGAALSRTLLVPLGGQTFLRALHSRVPFAYVGAPDGIHVYSIPGDETLIKRQTVASAYPVAMAISNWNLYVANGISEFAGSPRGTVESYGIDARSGKLTLKNRVPLSLSAISPRGLAVSPDASAIMVAVHGGGSYNVLPIQGDGSLGRVTGILKETGSGPHRLQASAHPSALVFDSAGRVLSVDQGSDRLNVFTLRNHEIASICRHNVISGSGPTSIVLHPKENRFFVAQGLNASISSFKYNPSADIIVAHEQTVCAPVGDGIASLAIHPSGKALYSSHGRGIHAWRIGANILVHTSSHFENVNPSALYATKDGKGLFALTDDVVLRIRIDASSQMPAAGVKVLSLCNPLSIAIV
jgi:6-phosphogluconolactonase